MSILKSIFNRLLPSQNSSRGKRTSQSARSVPPPEPEEDEPIVPEITVTELNARLVTDSSTTESEIMLLDVREQYEWEQVRMPNALHIPMNSIPNRLDELPQDKEVIVFCAHGQRSYGVAHYLLENGFMATSLAGGITDWAATGFQVDVGPAQAGD